MKLTQTKGQPKYLSVNAILGILLISPWVVVDMVLKKHEPSLGYVSGMFVGVAACYILSERPKFSILLMLAAILTINHFVFVLRWGL